MNNENNLKIREEAQKYFGAISEKNIKNMAIIAGAIQKELEVTTISEDGIYSFSFSPQGANIDGETAIRVIHKIDGFFQVLDTDVVSRMLARGIHHDGRIYLSIKDKNKFELFYQALNKFIEDQTDRVKFDEKNGIITLGKNKCKLTKHKGRFGFCKQMFKYPPGHEVSWDEIYQEISGLEPDNFGSFSSGTKSNEEIKRKILDAMIGINKQVKKYLDIDSLFKEENNHYKRTI